MIERRKKNYTTKADWDQEKKLMPIYAEHYAIQENQTDFLFSWLDLFFLTNFFKRP